MQELGWGSLRNLEEGMDSFEYEVWKEIYLKHPFGRLRQQIAQATAVIWNTAAFMKDEHRTAEAGWWLPQLPEEPIEQTTDTHLQMAEIIVTALGGTRGANAGA